MLAKEKTTNNQQRSQNIDKRSRDNVAAASKKTVFKDQETQEEGNCQEQEFNISAGQNQTKLEDMQEVDGENKNDGDCSTKEVKLKRVINPQWRSQIEELDNLGVEINKTITNLVKMYSEDDVKNAIALLKIRKREQHIPNMAGYFTKAIKGGWANKTTVKEENSEEDVTQEEVFRLWYELARELGNCTAQEVRDGEQWVLMSGSWEKWLAVVERGYTLEYLKKVMKRNL